MPEVLRTNRDVKKWFEDRFPTTVEVLSVARRKHWWVEVQNKATGQIHRLSLPTTPSDFRSLKNKESQIRTILDLRNPGVPHE